MISLTQTAQAQGKNKKKDRDLIVTEAIVQSFA